MEREADLETEVPFNLSLSLGVDERGSDIFIIALPFSPLLLPSTFLAMFLSKESPLSLIDLEVEAHGLLLLGASSNL